MRSDGVIIREIHLRWKEASGTGLGSLSGRNIVLLGQKVGRGERPASAPIAGGFHQAAVRHLRYFPLATGEAVLRTLYPRTHAARRSQSSYIYMRERRLAR